MDSRFKTTQEQRDKIAIYIGFGFLFVFWVLFMDYTFIGLGRWIIDRVSLWNTCYVFTGVGLFGALYLLSPKYIYLDDGRVINKLTGKIKEYK